MEEINRDGMTESKIVPESKKSLQQTPSEVCCLLLEPHVAIHYSNPALSMINIAFANVPLQPSHILCSSSDRFDNACWMTS